MGLFGPNLVKFIKCRKPVSEYAMACPHCGEPHPGDTYVGRGIRNIFSLVVAIAVLTCLGVIFPPFGLILLASLGLLLDALGR